MGHFMLLGPYRRPRLYGPEDGPVVTVASLRPRLYVHSRHRHGVKDGTSEHLSGGTRELLAPLHGSRLFCRGAHVGPYFLQVGLHVAIHLMLDAPLDEAKLANSGAVRG